MTVYLRPLNIQHSSGVASEFRPDFDDAQLLLQKSQHQTGVYTEVRKYDISQLEISQHSKKQQKFISYPANFWLRITFKMKFANSQNPIQAKLQLSKLLESSSFGKNDILTRFVTIGEYRLGYQFKCNRFLQVCGTTVHKNLAIYTKPLFDGNELKPLKTATFKDVEPKELPEHRQMAEGNDYGLYSQGSDIPLKEVQKDEKQIKKNKEVVFYKGLCENKNMFSCLDGEAEARKQKKFQMIQQPYG